MIKPYYSIILAIFVLLIVVVVYPSNKERIDSFFSSLFVKADAHIESIGVINNNFVIRGENLSTVELWVIPAGSGVTEDHNLKIGDAQVEDNDAPQQLWTFPVPRDPLLITEIYAKGFNKRKEVGRVSFPVVGATDIYNALWGNNGSANSAEISLQPGESASFDNLKITFLNIVQDSRCPVDVQCIQAGELIVSLDLSNGSTTKETILSSGEPSGKDFMEYNVLLGSIEPTKTVNVTPQNTQYTVTFLITKIGK